nr:unnamed protein product [Spirometra erinaceieuropaei]
MGLFVHMRIHESGIDRSTDTSTTSNTPTTHSPTPIPSPCAPKATTTSITDPTPPTFHAHIVAAHSPHASAWSVTCESIAKRLRNQCLESQPTPNAPTSTVHTALALPRIAWIYSATCASTKSCDSQPPAAPHYHPSLPPSPPSHHTSTSPSVSTLLPPPTPVGIVHLELVSVRLLLNG